MTDEFDPYYTWLGIPPAEQPADHYRLIGLRQFEGNADVISNAVDQKMQFLRTLQVGKRSALSQKLLNEISAAGGCLLDAKRKRAYDEEIRAKQLAVRANAKRETIHSSTPTALPVARPLASPHPLHAASAPLPLPASRPLPVRPRIEAEDNRPSSVLAMTLKGKPTVPVANSWKLPLVLGGVAVGGFVLLAMSLEVVRILNSQPQLVVVTPPKKVVKPANKEPIIPDVTIPQKEPQQSGGDSVTPKGRMSPPEDARIWWSSTKQLQGLVALQLTQTAQAEFQQSANSAALTTPLTVEMWIRLHLENEKPVQIFGTRLGHSSGGFVPKGWALLAKRTTLGKTVKDQLVLEIWRSTGEFVFYDIPLASAEEWHHVALTYEPRTGGGMFVDGRRLFLIAAEKNIVGSNRNLSLGSDLQPEGAAYQAECCGLRASTGIRYTNAFTPPTPLEMTRNEGTFAFLNCRADASAADAKLAESGVKWISLGTGNLIARPGSPIGVASLPNTPEPPAAGPMVNPTPFGSAPPPPKKLSVPTPEDLAKVMPRITANYGDGIKAAKTPQAKQDMAKKILDSAKGTQELPLRYAMLQEVRRLGVDARNVDLAFSALEDLDVHFEIDLFAQKIKLLVSLAGESMPLQQRTDLVTVTCSLGRQAVDEGKFSEAASLAATARTLAAKNTTLESRAESKQFFDFFQQQQTRHDAQHKAEQKLAMLPDDPEANLTVGLFQTFGRQDLQKGLSHLAKGSDVKLVAAAKARQENAAKGVSATLEEADAWFDSVAKAPGEYKVDLQRRALECYTILASGGPSAERDHAEKRRNQLSTTLAAVPERATLKRMRMQDLPEFTSGMMGRLLINGRDAGVLLTYQPYRNLEVTRLTTVMTEKKATVGRLVLEGTLTCPEDMLVRVFQNSDRNNGLRIVYLDSKPVNDVNAVVAPRSGSIPVPKGNHKIRWECDFDSSSTPRLDVNWDLGGGRLRGLDINCPRAQNYDARRLPTKSEINLSN